MATIGFSASLRPTTMARTQAPQPLRECERRPELFDLPMTESSVATVVFGPTGRASGAESFAVTFDDLEQERLSIDRFVRAARKATTACQGCFFLDQCQQEAATRIDAGERPTDEVVGAVAFNGQGVPEPRVHDRPQRRELDQLTLDEDMDFAAHRVDRYNEWVPTGLAPLACVDDLAVDLALNDTDVNMVITQTHLDADPERSAEGRIVLSYADEWAAIQRGVEMEICRYRLAQLLDCTYPKASEAVYILGREIEGYVPTKTAIFRRDVLRVDSERRRALQSRHQSARLSALGCRRTTASRSTMVPAQSPATSRSSNAMACQSN